MSDIGEFEEDYRDLVDTWDREEAEWNTEEKQANIQARITVAEQVIVVCNEDEAAEDHGSTISRYEDAIVTLKELLAECQG